MKFKESVAASILGPILTVFLVFTFLGSSVLFYANQYFFNTRKLVESMEVDEVIDELKDEIMEDVRRSGNYSDITGDVEEYEELIDAVFENKFIGLVLTETFDAALYGDDRIDRDALEDAFDDSTEEFFDEHDEISKSEIRDFRDTMIDSLEDAVAEEANSSEAREIQDGMNAVKNAVTTILITLVVISLLMIGILLWVYKNKASVLKLTGIALTISQGINLLGALAIRGLLSAAINEMRMEDPTDIVTDMVAKIISNFSNNAIVLFAVLLVIGIAAIVAGSIFAKKFIAEYNEDPEFADANDFN